MEEGSSWAPPRLREWPFWRLNMGPEEYEIEREYYLKYMFMEPNDGNYMPLWKQKENEKR